MQYPKSYAVYDLETTGLYPLQGDEAVEIGLLVVRDGIAEPLRTWLIKPEKPISDDITRITGITQEEVDAHGRAPAECWAEFLAAADNLPLVGHNIARFDNIFVMQCVRKYLPTPEAFEMAHSITKAFVDTAAIMKAQKLGEAPHWYETHMTFSERVLDIKAWGVKYSLPLSYQELGGAEQVRAHRVEGDITMTHFVYRTLCGLPEPQPVPPEQAALL